MVRLNRRSDIAWYLTTRLTGRDEDEALYSTHVGPNYRVGSPMHE